jgi:putative transposase
MLYVRRIGEKQWCRIYDYLKEFSVIYIRNEESCRRFVEAVFWMARSGAQWRLLPQEYGSWNTVYRRFADWAEKGIWYKMLYYFAQDADMEYIMVDSTILRAHACATPKKNIRNEKA